MAHTGGLCGALSGAIMGISLAVGRSSPDESVGVTYELTRQLLRRFEEQFGSISCPDLTGCDLSTEEGRRVFQENEVVRRCQEYVQAAAGIAGKLVEAQLRSRE